MVRRHAPPDILFGEAHVHVRLSTACVSIDAGVRLNTKEKHLLAKNKEGQTALLVSERGKKEVVEMS